jgi:putative two-component system response regulator
MRATPAHDRSDVTRGLELLPVEHICLTELQEPVADAARVPWSSPTPEEENTAIRGQLYRTISDLHAVIRQRENAHQATRMAHREILFRLAAAAEFKDDDTGIHLVRMGVLSAMVAAEVGVSPELCELLSVAAPMHDIGKIGIPDHILKKPGPLTPEERTIMQEHPAIGARLLGDSTVPELLLASDIAYTHHERFDGKGYPRGIAGEGISLASRIVALVDFYDALTMARCYRPAMDENVVAGMVLEGSGNHFDPEIVRVFLRMHPRLLEAKAKVSERVALDGPLEVLRENKLWQQI